MKISRFQTGVKIERKAIHKWYTKNLLSAENVDINDGNAG